MAISLVLDIANITNIMLPGFPFLGPRLLGNGFSKFKMFQVSRVSGAEVFYILGFWVIDFLVLNFLVLDLFLPLWFIGLGF